VYSTVYTPSGIKHGNRKSSTYIYIYSVFLGKSSINVGFSIAMFDYQRVSIKFTQANLVSANLPRAWGPLSCHWYQALSENWVPKKWRFNDHKWRCNTNNIGLVLENLWDTPIASSGLPSWSPLIRRTPPVDLTVQGHWPADLDLNQTWRCSWGMLYEGFIWFYNDNTR